MEFLLLLGLLFLILRYLMLLLLHFLLHLLPLSSLQVHPIFLVLQFQILHNTVFLRPYILDFLHYMLPQVLLLMEFLLSLGQLFFQLQVLLLFQLPVLPQLQVLLLQVPQKLFLRQVCILSIRLHRLFGQILQVLFSL